MDAETKSRAFEPFFSTKGCGAGTGLGLASVAETVRELRGVIGVERELEVGTTFFVLIPRADDVALKANPTDGYSEPLGGSETILVVEEERVVRQLLRRVLEREGYTVLEAIDDQTAVDAASHYPGPIDLLVTDLSFPHLQGQALAQSLRRQRPELNVLFTSCYPESAIRGDGVLDASVEMVEKPLGP